MPRFVTLRRAGALAASVLALAGFTAAPGHAATASPASATATGGSGPLPPGRQSLTNATPRTTLPGGVRAACGVPSRAGLMSCMALGPSAKVPGGRINPAAAQSPLTATQLQNAYNLVSAAANTATAGRLVAIVDAYDDPNAQPDLATYRTSQGLPACNTANEAGCLTVVNQNGQASPLPGVDTGAIDHTPGGWEFEESLDLDMVSAICPQCHILLVEANSPASTDLYAAEDAAVNSGAKFISNSWGGTEFPGETQTADPHFNHPGVAITFAAGDFGYDANLAPAQVGVPPLGTNYPAVSQYVTSVGGTTLTMAGNTRASEAIWSETGSGCSEASPKPAWQVDTDATTGCLNRTGNDVAAVADPNTPVAIYDSYPFNNMTLNAAPAGGTSAATSIIAGTYALAGAPTAGTYPAAYPYQHSTALNPITSGSNGTCEANRQYLCGGTDYTGTTYNAPVGWGTPNGTTAFTNSATGDVVTVPDPGTQDYAAGSAVSIPVPAVDSASGQTVSYSAAGLPSGLSISTATGTITGTVTAGTSTVTVTATDGTGAHGAATFNIVAVPNLLTSFHGVSGPVRLDLGGKCLDDTTNSSASGAKIQIWDCNGLASQNWEYVPDGTPGGAGTLQINGKCADITGFGTANGSKIQLWNCTGGANQQWYLAGSLGELINPVSGRCLDDTKQSTTNGTQVEIFDCNFQANQAWTPAASPVLSGVGGRCLDDYFGNTADGAIVDAFGCLGNSNQLWSIGLDSSLQFAGKCLDVTGRSQLDGALLQLWTCSTGLAHSNQQWVVWAFPVAGAHGAFGEILNANSNKCLAVSGTSVGSGLRLVQEDCYGSAAEIWALS